MTKVFVFKDYRTYLNEWIREKGRGEKSRLASAARCHLTYISQVLGGSAELSLEQANDLSTYFGHGDDEGDYFLLLVTFARAGNETLRTRLRQRMEKTQREQEQLKNRLSFKKTLELEDQTIYYGAWYHAAIHVLLTIEAYQTREKIAERLKLPLSQVTHALEFLEKTGLVIHEKDRYRSGEVNVYVGADSPLVARHHSNWRLQAIRSLDRNPPRDLHYSSVVSVAKKDVPEIRSILLSAIDQVRAKVRASTPEEALYCYAFDLFEV